MFLACIGAASHARAQSPGDGEALSLDQAVALALKANRSIQSADLEVKKAGDQIAAQRTRRLPSLSLSTLAAQRVTALDFRFDRGVFGIYPGIGPIPGENTSIHSPLKPSALIIGQIGQPLTPQYKIGLSLAQLRLGSEIAGEQRRAQRQAVVSQVKHAYYGILQTESALESVEESIRLYKELDRVTADYVAQQTALKSQSLEIKTRLAKAEYDALTLRNPLATQKEQLNSLLGRDVRTLFGVSPVAESDWREIDLEAARKAAVDRRPEVRQARLKARQAEQDRRVKKSEYIPDVSLTFNYFSPLNYGQLIPANIATVGITVDWEPFDWGRKKHEMAQKDRTAGQASLAVGDAESQVLIDVGARFRKLEETRQLLIVGRLAQETAREKLRVMTNRYKEQASLLQDVLQAQANLADANSQYRQALAAFWTTKADFETAIGEDP